MTMSRLSSSTYSSICFLVFLHFAWLLLLASTTTAKPMNANQPATTANNLNSDSTVSFVNQGRNRGVEFDSNRNKAVELTATQLQLAFGAIRQLPGPRSNYAINNSLDDAPVTIRITLDDELSMETGSEQHEGSTETPDTWNRIKLAIPVLEPVKHLVNAVGGGNVNDTHVRNNHHRLLGHSGVHHSPHQSSGNSSAIETEEDRETAIDSTGFDVLETLGSAGTVLWGLLQNIRKLFSASAGAASSASSGGSSSGGQE